MADSPAKDPQPPAPGWDAISAALTRLYPKQQPRHWGPIQRFAQGGPDPLDGISVFLHEGGPTGSHWHYVTFGMSELYAKELPNKQTSGWGLEFTFRLRRTPLETQPPQWPLPLMQNLARYVFTTSNVLGPGHYIHLNGPIASDQETALHAAMFVEDPELGALPTPNGKLRFLLIYGATVDELAAARAWDPEKLLAVVRQTNPLLVTDLARHSMLDDLSTADFVAAETNRDGSSSDLLAVPALSVESAPDSSLTITLGANSIGDLQALFRGRTAHARSFQVAGPTQKVTFVASNQFSAKTNPEKTQTEIAIPMPAATTLAETLHPLRGDYRIPQLPTLTFRVTPSEIKDHTGTKIVKVIG